VEAIRQKYEESNSNPKLPAGAGRTRPIRSAPVPGRSNYSKRNWFFVRVAASAPDVKICSIEMLFHHAEMFFIRWFGCTSDCGFI
jgi:hypothetical protein